MTNEERIKRMSRKELASYMCGLIYESAMASCDKCKYSNYCDREHNGVYVWLGKEVIKNDNEM